LTHRFRDLLALEPPTRTNSVFFSIKASHLQEFQKPSAEKTGDAARKTVALAFFETSTRDAHQLWDGRVRSARTL